jgi:protein TonB
VAYAVSASYARSEHMSPVAAFMAAGLHAATALALFWISPFSNRDLPSDPVEITMEEPTPPPVETPPSLQDAVKPPPPPPLPAPSPAPAAEMAPPPPPVAAAAVPQPKPQDQPVSSEPLGVTPVETVDKEPTKPAESKPAEAKPEPPQQAAATPPPPEPPLEKAAPQVEAPPAPLTMRDFVKVMPPPPAPQPPKPQPAPPQQHPPQTLQRSPLSTAPTHPPPENSSNASVSSFVNPATEAAHTRAKDAYLWQVIRKFSQYLPDLREKNEGGTVVLRFVIARDGRLVESSIVKSSGVIALDKGLLESLRAASPYPPLPADIPGAQAVFVQPIAAARR